MKLMSERVVFAKSESHVVLLSKAILPLIKYVNFQMMCLLLAFASSSTKWEYRTQKKLKPDISSIC